MFLGAGGIVINEAGELLVIQRDDTRTWTYPGGGLDMGELPTDAVVREVEEETGLKVYPVRLVGIFFNHIPTRGNLLVFSFRCIQRGGEITTSAESLQVGFTPTNPLGVKMLPFTAERTMMGVNHKGGAPVMMKTKMGWRARLTGFWLFRIFYPIKNWRRARAGDPYVLPEQWVVIAATVVRNEAGEVLWAKRADNGRWNLPVGRVEEGEAPWEGALRELTEETGLVGEITDCTGVYVRPEGVIAFVFSAVVRGGSLVETDESVGFQWVRSGDEDLSGDPSAFYASHAEWAADAVTEGREVTVFKRQNE